MPTKQTQTFQKVLVKKASKKERFTAAELIAELRWRVDELEGRVAALEKKRP